MVVLLSILTGLFAANHDPLRHHVIPIAYIKLRLSALPSPRPLDGWIIPVNIINQVAGLHHAQRYQLAACVFRHIGLIGEFGKEQVVFYRVFSLLVFGGCSALSCLANGECVPVFCGGLNPAGDPRQPVLSDTKQICSCQLVELLGDLVVRRPFYWLYIAIYVLADNRSYVLLILSNGL